MRGTISQSRAGRGEKERSTRDKTGLTSDTSNLSETLVRLPWELLGSPPVGDTLETVTLCDADDIDVLVVLKDGGDVDRLLEVGLCKLDLVRYRSSVDLDLHQVRLLLRQARLSDLGVCEHADDGAVLADALELLCDRLSGALCVLCGVLCEGLLLAPVPVLVEPPLYVVREVLGPDGRQRSQASWGLAVADDADDDHGWRLDDRGSLDDLSLVHLASYSVELANNVGHAGLVAEESGEVDRLLGVILGERLDLAAVFGSTLLGQETQRTVSRVYWSRSSSVF